LANYKPLGVPFDRTFRNDLNANFMTIDAVAAAAELKATNAEADSAEAKSLASQANTTSDSVQTQINNIVIDSGTSDAEVLQARGEYSVLNERLGATDTQLSGKAEQAKVQNFNLMSQSPKPTKSGITTNSPKLAIKTGTDAFMVIQNMGKGYVAHTLDSNGGTTEVSHGVNWELLRLKKSQHVSDAYLAYSTFQNVVGTLTESSPGTKTADIIDTNLTDYNSAKAESSSHKSSKAGDIGLSLYHIASSSAPSSVDFIIKTGRARKANAMIYGNTSGSTDVDILVNDQVVVKGINTKAFRSYGDSPGRNLIGIVEFDIPVLTTQTPRDIKITLRNNSLTDRLYFLGINFVKVKDYKGEYVDFYKILPNVLKWVDASGASDYAIREKDGLWAGSYHGGETRESGTIPWRIPTSTFIRSSADIGLSNFTDITLNDWCVLDDLTISQRTNLINKAKMLSNWNFDVDGTFNMSFGLYDNTMNIDLMYTSLTCTHVDFLYITYPKTFQVVDGIGNEFDIVEGKVTQRSASRGAELTVRFTKFNDFLSDKRVTVNSNSSYNKLYYSPISQISGGVVVPNLSFEKSLDFQVD
jgi:hypothetical protein